MAKPILCIDFDGTLCHDRFWRSADPELKSKLQTRLFSDKVEVAEDWMLGKRTSEEINQLLADELGMPYDFLWKIFVADCENMTIVPGAIKKVQTLRDRYTTVIITDNMDCFDRFTVPALGLDTHFDVIVNSSTEGSFKNDENGKVFQKIAEAYDSPLSRNILIDNAQSSCMLFESLGGRSYLVTAEEPLTYWLDGLLLNK